MEVSEEVPVCAHINDNNICLLSRHSMRTSSVKKVSCSCADSLGG